MKGKSIRLLLKWADKDSKWLVLSVLFGFIGGILLIGSYIGVYNMMEALVSGTCNREVVAHNAIIITSTVILRQLCMGVCGILSHKGAYSALYRVRIMVTEHLAHVPLGALNERRTGDMKTVLNENIEKMERCLAHNIPEFVSYFTGPIIIFIYLLTVNVKLALISLLPLLLVVVIMIFMFSGMMKLMDRATNAQSNFNSVIVEYINGMRLIKAYNMGAKSFAKFSDAITEENDVWNAMSKSTGPWYAAFIIALESGIVLLVPLGGSMLLSGHITAGVFLLFAYVGSMYLSELLPLQQLATELAQVINGIDQVKKIMDIPVYTGGNPFPQSTDITLKDVSFNYGNDERKVLLHTNLSIAEGEKLGIVGKSGSGKSTIVQLISRFYDVNEGQITIGGMDVKEIDYESLLKNISIVFQKSFMTSGTVFENIAMGKNATLEEVRHAARLAQIDDYIMSLPKQYETELGSIQARFSGGEKQRIAIARAILKDSKILILDEATSAADPENQAQIDKAIENLCMNKTVIIVAHRLDALKMCDKIAVVEENTVSAIGTHEELLETNEYYKNAFKTYKEAKDVKYKLA